jgi:hypothetical protein
LDSIRILEGIIKNNKFKKGENKMLEFTLLILSLVVLAHIAQIKEIVKSFKR